MSTASLVKLVMEALWVLFAAYGCNHVARFT
jgi:hypothetical protein